VAKVPAPSPPLTTEAVREALAQADARPLPAAMSRPRSQWVPVRWSSLPGLVSDPLHEAWNAWLRSCERPGPTWSELCRELRPLSLASTEEQLLWMLDRLQPYRLQATDGNTPEGLLTGYFEPFLSASRVRTATHTVPLYAPPARLSARQPWYSRQDIDTRADVQAELRGREIAWLDNPIDALMLQIQGSGRIRMTEPDGSERTVRLAFAAHNGHGYKSVGRWLLDRNAITDASWAAIKVWAVQHPQQVNDMLWSNPRTVFFREETLSPLDAQFGPRGAQGVPLTPERSIAVDPQSIPYGTPIWLASSGPTAQLQRLVLAQDTGSAIVGAVRADYFTGWGQEAGALAGGLKQPLQLWALWPRKTR
jgi:membrane-bound lytic murein transglycosylase A